MSVKLRSIKHRSILGWHLNHFIVVGVVLALLVSTTTRPKEKLRPLPQWPAPNPLVANPYLGEPSVDELEKQIQRQEKFIERMKWFLPEGPSLEAWLERENGELAELKEREKAARERENGKLKGPKKREKAGALPEPWCYIKFGK